AASRSNAELDFARHRRLAWLAALEHYPRATAFGRTLAEGMVGRRLPLHAALDHRRSLARDTAGFDARLSGPAHSTATADVRGPDLPDLQLPSLAEIQGCYAISGGGDLDTQKAGARRFPDPAYPRNPRALAASFAAQT